MRVGFARGGLAVATYRSILITYTAAEIDLEWLAAAHRIGKALAASNKGRIGSLTLISPEMKMPSGEVRAQAGRNTKEADAWVIAGATVVGGQGFWASAIRGALVAATLFEGGPPRRVFAEPSSACDWLGRRVALRPEDVAPLAEWSARALAGDLEGSFRKAS